MVDDAARALAEHHKGHEEHKGKQRMNYDPIPAEDEELAHNILKDGIKRVVL
ncbi:MAG TPA: hypothetical protein VGX76_14745 [Pirellulales bacterium]|jgi:hypothetical protein|nr:hypothetical protein [Pirellulales bacterium]